jgi:hypothetical protein
LARDIASLHWEDFHMAFKHPFAIVILLLCCFAAHVFGATIVVPHAQAGVVGDDNSGSLVGNLGSLEVQIDVGSGQFSSLTGPIDITGFSFRPEPGTGPVDVTIGNASISLSTSPNYPNSVGHPLMSTTFANNVGPDVTHVFSGSNITIIDPGCAVVGTAPCAFGTNIVFTTPFLYNPLVGPLLLDLSITNFVGISGEWDVETYTAPGGGIASVVGPLGSPTGTFQYSDNIVQLTFNSVPEPATWTTTGGAAILAWAFVRARRRRHS